METCSALQALPATQVSPNVWILDDTAFFAANSFIKSAALSALLVFSASISIAGGLRTYLDGRRHKSFCKITGDLALRSNTKMALGLHWEWRGFGSVSGGFAQRYSNLDPFLESQSIEDTYLWIPGIAVNAKFRKGVEGGLKLKRLKSKDHSLEQWFENPAELFDFPLDTTSWNTLQTVMAEAGLEITNDPPPAANRASVLRYLQKIGCRTVSVSKLRESKIWQDSSGKIKVEWVCITTPQICISIGLETVPSGSAGDSFSDDCHKKLLYKAIQELGVEKEPLKVMNYMDVVNIWAEGKFI
ncbi:MAG: hypothetical protein PVF39_08795 [Desulfobacterales bacterium]|jgi:hypothetical protein